MEYRKVRMTEAQEKACEIFDLMLDFVMSVDEVFTSPEVGTVVTGFVEQGAVYAGSLVTAIDRDGQCTKMEVREVVRYKQDKSCPLRALENNSLRFDRLKEGTIREGDIIVSWISCPQWPENWLDEPWEPGNKADIDWSV